MSDSDFISMLPPSVPVEELARQQGVRPTTHPLRDPGALSPPMRTRRGITLLLMTLVVPGSAQVTAGNRRLGRIHILRQRCDFRTCLRDSYSGRSSD